MADAASLRLLVVGVSRSPETFLARLIQGLSRAGIEITLASEQKPGKEWPSECALRWLRAPTGSLRPGSGLVRLGSAWGRAVLRARGDLKLLARYSRQTSHWRERIQFWQRVLPFAGRRWDLVYFPWNTAAISHLPLFDLGSPVVVSCRGSQVNIAPHNPRRASLREGLRETFERAVAVHCVSESIRQEATALGLHPAKSWVIRPAVDPDQFYPGGRQPAAGEICRIVTTGSIIWAKGYEYALLALRHLLDQGVPASLEIIGDGPERSHLVYTARDLQLASHVRLHGRLSPDRVRDRLQDADLFLLSSVSEGISNAVLEAMACGLPVVTTDCGGMREAVTDGCEGFVVPVRDSRAAAAAMARLASDPALRQRMGRAARERVLREFRLDQQIEQWLALCRAVTDGAVQAGRGAQG